MDPEANLYLTMIPFEDDFPLATINPIWLHVYRILEAILHSYRETEVWSASQSRAYLKHLITQEEGLLCEIQIMEYYDDEGDTLSLTSIYKGDSAFTASSKSHSATNLTEYPVNIAR